MVIHIWPFVCFKNVKVKLAPSLKSLVLTYDYHHHHHVPGLLQTSAITAFRSSLSSVLVVSSLLGDSFLVIKLFRLSVYFVRCHPLLLVLQIFSLNICFSSPSALFVGPKNCSCLFMMVLSWDLLIILKIKGS